MHDIKLTYFCDNTWDIVATLNPTRYSKTKATQGKDDLNSWEVFAARKVDPVTCKLEDTTVPLEFETEEEQDNFDFYMWQGLDRDEYFQHQREEGNWSNIMLILFSMKVATGFIASYTPTTFYLILVYGLAGQVRLALIFMTWMGYTYEVTMPKTMMTLCECCYMMRHEENLVAEEECYRMLQEIIRQP